jgi:adenylate cyclase
VSLKGELLLEVARVLAEPDDEVVVSKIVDLLFQIFDIDRAAVLLRDRSGRVGVRKARARDDAAPMSDRLHSQSIVEFVMTQGLAAVFADARHDQRLGGAESVMLQSIQSSMGAPLRARENVFGALYVDNVQTTDRFTPEDLDYLVAFANQAAVAIDNARMAKELERAAVVRANLSRFFSPAIAQQILTTGGDQLPTTRTFVTALFCDISDYTEIASGMDPLEVVSMLNRYFPTVADVVFAHGGMLEKYIGDAILAVWGAPYPQPDDADRAVAAAVEIRKAVAAMNLRPDRRHPPISVHIGLCSGPVAAGNVGSDAYVQYATIGDATNVAARVSASARAGEIRIAEATWDRLRERPAADVIEGVLLKGKEGTHRVYRLT